MSSMFVVGFPGELGVPSRYNRSLRLYYDLSLTFTPRTLFYNARGTEKSNRRCGKSQNRNGRRE